MTEDRPPWDQDAADRLIGAVVVVGMTYNEPSGGERVDQFFGTVVSAVAYYGFTLRLGGSRVGETFRLPPDPGAFVPADPGRYRLKTTGDFVDDPDYTTTWTVNSPMN